ncbi:ThuA domain-containing protein [Rhodopirellula halodulae]|uniref:ThuA domain-containing protein n=1 Tax=Rhodopirellula halodulae TaxID=2894198 RepID=UPI001E609A7F|nr:hypothetical protein [Rhodopirellula sp. JC737]MCC9657486.1 hypothetical protein [Rhodopirellula sp. JC737]
MKTWFPLAAIAFFLTPFGMPNVTVADESSSSPLVYEGEEGIGKGKHIVFIANDHEYRSEQSCPTLAKILAKHHGFRCTVLFGINEQGEIQAGDAPVPGMEALKDADLLFFFTRFMKLPDEQVDLLVDYFERGGPVVGARTSTHCFNGQQGKWAKLNFNYEGDDYLGGLGEQIFGNTWHSKRGQSHYGGNHSSSSRITALSSAKDHPILSGVGIMHAYSGAYKSQPPTGSTPLVEVQVLNTFEPSDDVNEDKPKVSAGWTTDHYVAPSGEKKDARVAYFSFGAGEDLLDEDTRRCFANACLWALGMEDQIQADLDMSLVGSFVPTPFTTGALYRDGVKPSELSGWESEIMPTDHPLGGMEKQKMVRKVRTALKARPELKEHVAEKYPDLYGDLAD